MLKLYSLIKNELITLTYSDYQDLDADAADALIFINSEFSKIQSKKLETEDR